MDGLILSALSFSRCGLSDLGLRVLDDRPHAASGRKEVGPCLAHAGEERFALLLNKGDTGQIDNELPSTGGLAPASGSFISGVSVDKTSLQGSQKKGGQVGDEDEGHADRAPDLHPDDQP